MIMLGFFVFFIMWDLTWPKFFPFDLTHPGYIFLLIHEIYQVNQLTSLTGWVLEAMIPALQLTTKGNNPGFVI